MIVTILKILLVVIKKAMQLHDVGADVKVLKEIYDISHSLKEVVDKHHSDHKHLIKEDDFD